MPQKVECERNHDFCEAQFTPERIHMSTLPSIIMNARKSGSPYGLAKSF